MNIKLILMTLSFMCCAHEEKIRVINKTQQPSRIKVYQPEPHQASYDDVESDQNSEIFDVVFD